MTVTKALGLGIIVLLTSVVLSGCTIEATRESRVVQKEAIYPSPTNYVVDTSEVISEDLEISLNKNLEEFKNTAEIAVVTVPTTYPLDEKQYAINLARQWGIGSAEKDNGILFLIVTEDRKVRIETGRGNEGIMTDAEAGRILDTAVVPSLRNNDWEDGIKKGVIAIMEGLK